MTHVDWHPYPKEKPEEWESKIVTFKRTQRKTEIQVAFFFCTGDKGVWMSPLNSTIFEKLLHGRICHNRIKEEAKDERD